MVNFITKININVKENKGKEFLMKCLQILCELGPSKTTICEWMYWYIEGSEAIRRFVRSLFDLVNISEHNSHFYREIDSWETWKIEENSGKRKQIKKICLDWVLRYKN